MFQPTETHHFQGLPPFYKCRYYALAHQSDLWAKTQIVAQKKQSFNILKNCTYRKESHIEVWLKKQFCKIGGLIF